MQHSGTSVHDVNNVFGWPLTSDDADDDDDAAADDDDELMDVLIVGGGVVGLSILHAIVTTTMTTTTTGYTKACCVEQEEHLLTWASGSNSGIVCTGVDAAVGTLERALIRDSVAQIRPFLRNMNIPHRTCGSLVCTWLWDDPNANAKANAKANDAHVTSHDTIEDNRLDRVLAESHDAGDTQARKLTAQELIELEPNLRRHGASGDDHHHHHDEACQGAVHIPGEIVVDPWLYSISFAVRAREMGATILTNFKAICPQWNAKKEYWVVRNGSKETSSNRNNNNNNKRYIRAKVLINATGVWSDEFQTQALTGGGHGTAARPTTWTARPRRGQYRVYQSRPDTRLVHPIQPVPTQRTKGIFVFSTIYNQIVVGPTALDQASKTDRSIDATVAQQLDDYAGRILPRLDPKHDWIGDYCGIRPGTDQRDYQFQVHYERKLIAACGIRSTGLTASLGIGRHVVHLLSHLLPPPLPHLLLPKTVTPLPPVEDLILDFAQRQRPGDDDDNNNNKDLVEIHGHLYKVTHPITLLGWTERIAARSGHSPEVYTDNVC